MPAAANIVLADALATPVNHTFVPIGPDASDASCFWFEDQSQSNAIGYWKISIKLKRPAQGKPGQSSGDRSFRATLGLHEPILEVVSNSTVSGIAPAPTISYIPRAFCEFVMPERSNLQNRKDIRKMMALLVDNPQSIAVIENLQNLW